MHSARRDIFVRQPFDAAGFSRHVADGYRELIGEANASLDAAGVPSDGRRTWIVPGRVEVLGKHVDYAGGRSLLCAVERGMVLVARVRDDRKVVLRDARRREAITMSLDAPMRGAIPWTIYPRTVMQRLSRNFGALVPGVDVALASNLPPAAGVSSSSALTVGLTLVFVALGNLAAHPDWDVAIPDRAALAGYVGALENGGNFGVLSGERGVGTMGGAQDQTAILCSGPGQLDVFRWAPVSHERSVTWPAAYGFVVGVSGVVAAKTGAAKERYNRAARTVHRLVDAWNAHAAAMGKGTARTLYDAFLAANDGQLPAEVPPVLVDIANAAADEHFAAHHLVARLGQFFDETFVFVPGAVDALQANDLERFGRLVDLSQAGAERALENQIAETVHLQRYAREAGAVAASAFGAGFGGSVWAMVQLSEAEPFITRWREKYARAHRNASQRAQFFVTSPGPPAFEVVG